MPTKAYLQSVKNPELKFLVLKYDAATKTATLQGRAGTFPITPFTPAKVKEDGYILITEDASESSPAD